MQRLILTNFREGDWHITLTYRKSERPESLKEAKEQRRKFFKNMRKAYKKAGFVFKYICVTEIGKHGAAHHHLIIEDIATSELNTKDLVMQYWKYGARRFTPMYEEGEFKNLAEYLVKEEGREYSYTRSRNLIVPQPKKEKVYGRKWDEEPQPEKGYYIIKDSLINGINPVTGRPYQHYMMRRLPGKEAVPDGGGKGVCGNLMEGTGKTGRRRDVAHRMQKARNPNNQTGIHPPGKRNTDAGNPDGDGKRIPHPEKAMQHTDLHKVWTRAKRGAKRLAHAVAGKRMEKRQRERGKER